MTRTFFGHLKCAKRVATPLTIGDRADVPASVPRQPRLIEGVDPAPRRSSGSHATRLGTRACVGRAYDASDDHR